MSRSDIADRPLSSQTSIRVTPALYLRTLRNLKPTQLLHLPLQRAKRSARRSLPGLVSWRYRKPATVLGEPAEALSQVADSIARTLDEVRPHDLEPAKQGRLSFMGRAVELADVDWEEDYRPALWGYHLHYFDDAMPLAYAAKRGDDQAYKVLRSWILDWIRHARPGRGQASPNRVRRTKTRLNPSRAQRRAR